MLGTDSNVIIKNCLNCSKEFIDTTKSHNASYCSSRCGTAYRNSKKFEGKQEGYDYIRCPECFQKVAEVSRLHAKMHGFDSVTEMSKHYGVRTLKCERILENMSGKNNPGYQHGGKLSPWSSNNPNLSDNDLKENYKKAEESRKRTRPNEIQSWLNKGFSEDAAKIKVKERQTTFSLEICIEKYGEEEGKKRWAERQKIWLDSFPRLNYSKISQKLFWSIFEKLEDKSSIRFATKGDNDEYQEEFNNELRMNLGSKTIVPDFICSSTMKIIEFDGDYWHSEARVNKKREDQRSEILQKYGYSVLRIREQDYNKDPEMEITKCLNFLKQ